MKPRRAVLAYHSLDGTGSVISTPPQVFREQMQFLKRDGVPVVDLNELAAGANGVAITFDDGFRSVYEHAAPLLGELGFPATVFVVSGHAGGQNNWPSQPAHIPRFELLSWTGLRDLERHGIHVGAHTASHPFLTRLRPADAETEMVRCRDEIQQRMGAQVKTFAYPYGDTNPVVRELASRHFEAACGTSLAFAGPGSDRLALPRLDTWYLQNPLWFENLWNPAGHAYLLARRAGRAVRNSIVRT